MKIGLKLLLIILIIQFKSALGMTNQIENQPGHRIGIISLFPGKSGLFFDDRMFLCPMFFYQGNKRLFPQKGAIFHKDVNNLIVNFLVKCLKKQPYSNQEFIELPPLNTYDSVTGYRIEGDWGVETSCIDVKGLKTFFQQKNLDHIIAIIPVTYHVPKLDREGTGIQILLCDDKMVFSCCYCIIVFSKHEKSYKKAYSSIKQVYIKSKQMNPIKKYTKTYDQKCIDEYYLVLEESFISQILKQCTALLRNKDLDTMFPPPKKSLLYFLPH